MPLLTASLPVFAQPGRRRYFINFCLLLVLFPLLSFSAVAAGKDRHFSLLSIDGKTELKVTVGDSVSYTVTIYKASI
jgi:hypothetical protein